MLEAVSGVVSQVSQNALDEGCCATTRMIAEAACFLLEAVSRDATELSGRLYAMNRAMKGPGHDA